MRLLRSRPLAVLVVAGAVLVVVGGAWFVGSGFGAVESASFGWFAYAPTTGTSFSGNVVVLSRSGTAAVALVLVGALVLSAAAGYSLGRRRAAAQNG